jgi:hypothetical protein
MADNTIRIKFRNRVARLPHRRNRLPAVRRIADNRILSRFGEGQEPQ